MKRNKVRKLIVSLAGIIFIVIPTISVLATPTQSTYTPQVELLLAIVILVSVGIASIVFGLLIYVVVRYREGNDTVRKRIQNENRLEIAWIIFAAVTVLSLFVVSLPVTNSYFIDQEVYDEEILVIAYQSRTVDVVHLKVNKMYKFNLSSVDVIHSFYAHELSIKLDMVPGRFNIVFVEVSVPGVYEVHCAEYCGFGHYLMEAKIIVT
ncbi:MAG: cytochrome c oxidase subunit II transmembrane domain-containing protein [Candidatus Kariarchaeaceae archaeon]|jgi:heme/copper-type cytochrome/quinol oxidase subunit 2